MTPSSLCFIAFLLFPSRAVPCSTSPVPFVLSCDRMLSRRASLNGSACTIPSRAKSLPREREREQNDFWVDSAAGKQ